MLSHIWNTLPFLSAAVVGSIGTLMTAWPKAVSRWEQKNTLAVRIVGISMAMIGLLGSISGYQQQALLVTKNDLTPLATHLDIERINKANTFPQTHTAIQKKDISFFINNQLVGNSTKTRSLITLTKEELKNIVLIVHNDSQFTLREIQLQIVIWGCQMSGPSWQEPIKHTPEYGALSFNNPNPANGINPKTRIAFPSINANCTQGIPYPGLIEFSIKDTDIMRFPFTFLISS